MPSRYYNNGEYDRASNAVEALGDYCESVESQLAEARDEIRRLEERVAELEAELEAELADEGE